MKKSADPNSDNMQAEFRQKLENYQAAPSQNLWDKIELSLDKEEALVYKNRFRTYSRLAAACLLLLLAFGAFFIPKELKHLKEGNQEIATAQNPVADEISGPEMQRQSERSAPENTVASNGTASENAMLPNEKTAGTYSETEALTTAAQPINAEIAPQAKVQNKGKTKAQNALALGNAAAEKTVAFNPPKVRARASEPENSAFKTPQNAMVSAAKTVEQETAASKTSSANQTGFSGAETTLAAVTQPANIAYNAAPEMANTDQEFSSAGKEPSAVTRQSAKNAAVAAAFQKQPAADEATVVSESGSFPAQNASVSEAKTSRPNLSFLKSKTPRLANVANTKLTLPDSNMLAVLPMPENLSETEDKPEKAPSSRKWQLALAYSGSSFTPGMRLASQAEIAPSASLQDTRKQAENIAQYEEAIREFNQETRPGYLQGGALQVAYKFTKNWLLQSGFRYFRNQAQTPSEYAFVNQKLVNTGVGSQLPQRQLTSQTLLETVLENSFEPNNTQILKTPGSKTSYVFQQIGVPLNLRYQTNTKALYYFGAAGFSMNLLTSATIKTSQQQTVYTTPGPAQKDLNTSNAPQEQAFRSWLPAVSLQTGAGYHLSSHWQVEMALEGEQYLKPLIQAERTVGAKQQNPRSVGATVKLGYSF